jgi:hypothetical protein
MPSEIVRNQPGDAVDLPATRDGQVHGSRFSGHRVQARDDHRGNRIRMLRHPVGQKRFEIRRREEWVEGSLAAEPVVEHELPRVLGVPVKFVKSASRARGGSEQSGPKLFGQLVCFSGGSVDGDVQNDVFVVHGERLPTLFRE